MHSYSMTNSDVLVQQMTHFFSENHFPQKLESH